MIRRCIYVGAEHPELKGEVALVQKVEGNLLLVRAQFHDTNLHSPRLAETREGLTVPGARIGLRWGHGWHELPERDFR